MSSGRLPEVTDDTPAKSLSAFQADLLVDFAVALGDEVSPENADTQMAQTLIEGVEMINKLVTPHVSPAPSLTSTPGSSPPNPQTSSLQQAAIMAGSSPTSNLSALQASPARIAGGLPPLPPATSSASRNLSSALNNAPIEEGSELPLPLSPRGRAATPPIPIPTMYGESTNLFRPTKVLRLSSDSLTSQTSRESLITQAGTPREQLSVQTSPRSGLSRSHSQEF